MEYVMPVSAVGYPGDTSYNRPYGCVVGLEHNIGMLRSMQTLSPGDTIDQRKELIYRLVQRGIDLHYTTTVTPGGRNYATRGGCVTVGLKPLIMYAGNLLNGSGQQVDSSMITGALAIGDEDQNSYWSATCNGGAGCGLWGSRTDTCKTTLTDCAEMIPVCGGLKDGGHCVDGPGCTAPACGSEGATKEQQRTVSAILADNNWTMTAYQGYSGVRVAGVAVARILGFEDEWNWPAFFSLWDRIADSPWSNPGAMDLNCPNGKDGCHAYIEKMYYTYGCTSAECEDARNW
jgi:hypothetical protein